jgi:Protein of unknown function (DUF3667)
MSADALPTDAGTCRNCGASAPGSFCPSCGQETDVRLPTLRQFMREATGRLIALDGRLWRTMYALVAKPGFLTREYLDGRRRRYVRPTRLFLVTSIVLFATLRFAVPPIKIDDKFVVYDDSYKAAAHPGVSRPPAAASKDNDVATGVAAPVVRPDAEAAGGFQIALDPELNFVIKGPHNIFSDPLNERLERFNRLPKAEKGEQISAGMLRYGPYAMFVLLPVFAWLQMVSYAGRSGRYPGRPRRYIEHLVYATHMHTLLFLAATAAILIPWTWPRWLVAAWVVYYVSSAKRTIYGGSRLGALVRGLFVAVTYTITFFLAIVALIFPAILLR